MTRRRQGLSHLLAFAMLFSIGCEGAPMGGDGGTDAGVSGRGFAESCVVTADCASQLCLEVARNQGVCTRICSGDADCPVGPNWGCVQPAGLERRVCGCSADSEEEVCGDGLDNECNGLVDDCRICGGIPVPEDSPLHCGACFAECRGDQECHTGSCRCAEPGAMECGDECANLQTDSDNCGACDFACDLDELCSAGACTCRPPNDDRCGTRCTDMDRDPVNCGECGRSCLTGSTCSGGVCSCLAPAAPDLCPDVGCVNLQTSTADCGECGNACHAGEICSDGVCQCPTVGRTWCNGVCRDLETDVSTCGSCTNACRPGERCQDGGCVCDSGLICDGTCVSSSDAANCGACGRTCRVDQLCRDLTCQCSAGRTECDGACVYLPNDPLNCGSCGNVCGTGMYCSSGVCRCTTSAESLCEAAGGCVDLRTNESHCGACETACPAVQECSNRVCSCPVAGHSYCDSSGTCEDLANDRANCGTCGNVCPGPMECRSGSCRCPTAGESYCADSDSCVSLAWDPLNCGSCSNRCPADGDCYSSVCRCDDASLSVCGEDCADLSTDEAHCGTCGTACTGGRVCITGACQCAPPTTDTEIRLTSTAPESVPVASAGDGSRVALLWREGGSDLYFTIIDATGARLMADLAIATGASGVTSLDLAWNGTEWAAVWNRTLSSPTRTAALFQRITSAGVPSGSPVEVTAGWGLADPLVQTVAVDHGGPNGWGVGVVFADIVMRAALQLMPDSGPLPARWAASAVSPAYFPYTYLDVVGADTGRFLVSFDAGHKAYEFDATGAARIHRFSSIVGYPAQCWDGHAFVTVLRERSLDPESTEWIRVHRRLWTYSSPVMDLVVSSTPIPADWFSIDCRGPDYVVTWSTGTSASRALSVARIRGPGSTFAGPATIAMPPTPLFAPPTVTRAAPSTVRWTSPDGFRVVWPDIRHGATELYTLGGTFPVCM